MFHTTAVHITGRSNGSRHSRPAPCAQFVEHVAGRSRSAWRCRQAQQQQRRQRRQHGRRHERRARAGPCHQRAGHGRAGGECRAAGQLEPRVGARQRVLRHQRRHQRRRSHGEPHGAGGADEAEHGQHRQRQRAAADDQQQRQQRQRAHAFGHHHQPRARPAIGQHPHRDRQQQERQRLRSRQQADLAGAGLQQQHRDDRHRGQADLLGRLRGEVAPRQSAQSRCRCCVRVGRVVHARIIAAHDARHWPHSDACLCVRKRRVAALRSPHDRVEHHRA